MTQGRQYEYCLGPPSERSERAAMGMSDGASQIHAGISALDLPPKVPVARRLYAVRCTGRRVALNVIVFRRAVAGDSPLTRRGTAVSLAAFLPSVVQRVHTASELVCTRQAAGGHLPGVDRYGRSNVPLNPT